uniref:Cytochrome b5 n=1 Tax=Anthurium amnicola TaxID=1678845 RepID=A0A1D1XH65_9ARAE
MEELRKISASEVRLHTSKNDCWLVIHGKVYDVTKFVDEHPGGHEVLLHASGIGDTSQTFEDVGHSSSARRRMAKYEIGVVEGYDAAEAMKKTKPKEEILAEIKAQQAKAPLKFTDVALPLTMLAVAIGGWFLLETEAIA